jgi:hypothetical protein
MQLQQIRATTGVSIITKLPAMRGVGAGKSGDIARGPSDVPEDDAAALKEDAKYLDSGHIA